MFCLHGCLLVSWLLHPAVILDADAALTSDLGALAAQQKFRPVERSAVDQTRQEVSAACRRLARHLAGQGQQDLRRILYLEDLIELASGETRDLETLKDIRSQFAGDIPGVESPEVREVAGVLSLWMQQLEDVGNTQNLESEFLVRQRRLRELLDVCSGAPTAAQHRRIREDVRWFRDHRQAAPLLQALRQSCSYPNLVARIDPSAMRALSQMQLTRVEPIRDDSEEMVTRGQGQIIATAYAEPEESEERGRFRLHFSGEFTSRTTSYRGPIQFRTSGRAHFVGHSQIHVDATTISTVPSEVSADFALTPKSVAVRRCLPFKKLLRRIAWRKIRKELPTAERASERDLERQLASAFDAEIEQIAQTASKGLHENITAPALRREMYPRDVDLRCDATGFHLRATEDAQSGLAAHQPLLPGAIPQGNVALHIHESMLTTLVDRLVATNRLLALSDLQVLNDNSPFAFLRVSNVRDPFFLLYLESDRPLRLEFQDATLHLRVKAAQLEIDGKTYPGGEFDFPYALSHTQDRLTLTLLEPAAFAVRTEPGATNGHDPSLPKLVEERFISQFLREVIIAPIDPLQDDGDEETNDRPQLKWKAAQADDGWLSLGMEVSKQLP